MLESFGSGLALGLLHIPQPTSQSIQSTKTYKYYCVWNSPFLTTSSTATLVQGATAICPPDCKNFLTGVPAFTLGLLQSVLPQQSRTSF